MKKGPIGAFMSLVMWFSIIANVKAVEPNLVSPEQIAKHGRCFQLMYAIAKTPGAFMSQFPSVNQILEWAERYGEEKAIYETATASAIGIPLTHIPDFLRVYRPQTRHFFIQPQDPAVAHNQLQLLQLIFAHNLLQFQGSIGRSDILYDKTNRLNRLKVIPAEFRVFPIDLVTQPSLHSEEYVFTMLPDETDFGRIFSGQKFGNGSTKRPPRVPGALGYLKFSRQVSNQTDWFVISEIHSDVFQSLNAADQDRYSDWMKQILLAFETYVQLKQRPTKKIGILILDPRLVDRRSTVDDFPNELGYTESLNQYLFSLQPPLNPINTDEVLTKYSIEIIQKFSRRDSAHWTPASLYQRVLVARPEPTSLHGQFSSRMHIVGDDGFHPLLRPLGMGLPKEWFRNLHPDQVLQAP